jgi:hypothetical protein
MAYRLFIFRQESGHFRASRTSIRSLSWIALLTLSAGGDWVAFPARLSLCQKASTDTLPGPKKSTIREAIGTCTEQQLELVGTG